MAEKVGWWAVGTVVGGALFSACFYGFFFLHGLIVADRAEAATNLSVAIDARNVQMNRLADLFEEYRRANDADHKVMLEKLTTVIIELKR
jgi:hypothetical protein